VRVQRHLPRKKKVRNKRPRITKEMVELMKPYVGQGVGTVLERFPRPLDDPRVLPWVLALDAADHGDRAPLCALLRSSDDLPAAARWYIADLIERYQWRRPKHRPRTPVYEMSVAEATMDMAVRAVRAGADPTAVAEEFEFDEVKLGNALEGKRGDERRARKRRPR
jgi:hypothetical protein